MAIGTTGKDNKPDPRGPFKQASSAMHSLRKLVVTKNAGLGNILFWLGVIFPYVDFPVHSSEWHPWQVIDRGAFQAQSIGRQLLGMIESARRHLQSCATTHLVQ